MRINSLRYGCLQGCCLDWPSAVLLGFSPLAFYCCMRLVFRQPGQKTCLRTAVSRFFFTFCMPCAAFSYPSGPSYAYSSGFNGPINSLQNRSLTRNQITGIKSEGSMFSVLASFIFSMDRPEAAIRIPPTMETSVSSSGVRNELRKPAHR